MKSAWSYRGERAPILRIDNRDDFTMRVFCRWLATCKEHQKDEEEAARDEDDPVVSGATMAHIQVFDKHLKEAILASKHQSLDGL